MASSTASETQSRTTCASTAPVAVAAGVISIPAAAAATATATAPVAVAAGVINIPAAAAATATATATAAGYLVCELTPEPVQIPVWRHLAQHFELIFQPSHCHCSVRVLEGIHELEGVQLGGVGQARPRAPTSEHDAALSTADLIHHLQVFAADTAQYLAIQTETQRHMRNSCGGQPRSHSQSVAA